VAPKKLVITGRCIIPRMYITTLRRSNKLLHYEYYYGFCKACMTSAVYSFDILFHLLLYECNYIVFVSLLPLLFKFAIYIIVRTKYFMIYIVAMRANNIVCSLLTYADNIIF
jgi:hypothetical protein